MPAESINKSLLIKVIVLLFIFFLFQIFNTTFSSLNTVVENVFSLVQGETQPDSNIVIIHISEDDLSSIGPWPLKRSYYALLINSLEKYKVKRIGIEIFLSSRVVTQTIYDNVLVNEIDKAGNVVLASVAGNMSDDDVMFTTDSLSYPSPKLLNKKIKTGHLNFLSKNRVIVPLQIIAGSEVEKSFSVQLAESGDSVLYPQSIEVNSVSSWQRFTNYSMLDFFELVENEDPVLESLKNKIIIIGVSDPLIAVSVKSSFDERLPGVALHAFAVDNLLNQRWLDNSYYFISGIVFLIILLVTSFFISNIKHERKFLVLVLVFIAVLGAFGLLFNYSYIKVNSFFFITATVFLSIVEVVLFYFHKNEQIKGAVDEGIILKKLLAKKEEELKQIQFQLEQKTDEKSDLLLDRIEGLKSDIDKLRTNEESEKEIVEIDSSGVHVFEGIVYSSKSMSKVIETIKKVAPENVTVLISGESGTGKELVAKAVHSLSSRNKSSFVAVNCGALSDTLLESELFGHVKGAFTGAVNDKIGRFEAADKGTIFLDEIAETTENFQVKLLRVIQTGDYEKVGSSVTSHSDVRIIAATNVNIELAVKENKFREDLFYRLNVIRITLPPLKERKEDILAITHKILSTDYPGLHLSKAVSSAFQNYEWRGNVRELEAVIKRAAIFARSDSRVIIQLADLPKEIVKESRLLFEDIVLESLRTKNFSHSAVSETAKELGGIGRTVVAENFRGIVFRTLSETGFDQTLTSQIIAGNSEAEIIERVSSKITLLMNNIEKDLSKTGINNYEPAKKELASKYKNLPQKFHAYLDEFIKWKIGQ